MRRATPGGIAVALAALALAGPAAAAQPLNTGFLDPLTFESPTAQATAFTRARSAGTTNVRLVLHWVNVAPASRPPSFDADNPYEPSYNWGWFDAQVRLAKAQGLEPIVPISIAPRWATSTGDHVTRPDPDALAAFARAAARRYDGHHGATPGDPVLLPRVRYWQVWNEPNRDYFLMPQFDARRKIVAASWYRTMVARMGTAIRGVDPTNRVIGGALAPMARKGKPAPLPFMRTLMCVSERLRRTCDLRKRPIRIDVWAHHPYTPGGPTHKAAGGGDVLISGLPKMRRILKAAIRLGHVVPRGGIGFWATEFGWDTRPPDPKALPMWLHARWTSEALYRMWKAGISSVTWWRVEDDPLAETNYQSGFYTTAGERKLSFQAFRFPTVGFRTASGIQVWGRTPFGRKGTVSIYVKTNGSWRRIGRLRTSVFGVFHHTYRVPYRGSAVKAGFGGEQSLGFGLAHVRDRSVVPFGCGGSVPCR